ncbi:uncharacterized protein HKW66_Vig0129460 [Vigna angularis]|uniref:Uncharacterized protein n=1 Tax=Phaseolus angularis TaxID=3914 RepID=A0A8T0K5G7_PHAAN|nr:uncharacterized protein HKW66_Vig0129460 [Vigna angularis]
MGSLRDEGAAERLRRFRVRRNTRDLGFCLAVVLDWSKRTQCSGTVILGMPWMTRKEEKWARLFDSLQVKNGDACLICGLGCCAIGVMVHEKRNRDCSAGEDERSSSTSNVAENEETSWHTTWPCRLPNQYKLTSSIFKD